MPSSDESWYKALRHVADHSHPAENVSVEIGQIRLAIAAVDSLEEQQEKLEQELEALEGRNKL